MTSAEFLEEELRLALAQPKLAPDVRREAATAFAALTDQRARLEAAEGRYDHGEDLEGLDEALRVFEAIVVTRAWPACPADRRADLGRRASRIYRKRYEVTGDERDLRNAISTSEAAVDAARSAVSAMGDLEETSAAIKELLASRVGREQAGTGWAMMSSGMPGAHAEMRATVASCEAAALAALGEDLAAAFDRHADREIIDRAVEALERARALRAHGGLPPSCRVALHLGGARLLRFKSYGTRADADASIVATREAVDTAEDTSARGDALDGLGCTLLARSEITEGDVDLTEAIACLEQASALVADPWISANLATALSARFKQGGDRADATRAAQLLDAALAEIPRTAPDRARLEQNALAIRYELDGSGDTASATGLLKTTPAAARSQPARLGALAYRLLDEAEQTLTVETLDEAVRTFQQALDGTTTGAVDRPSLLHGLGRGLAVRFALLGTDEDLDAALETLRDAVAAAGQGGPELPDFKLSLGMAASMRATRTASAEDRRAATVLFSEACSAGHELNALAAVRAAWAWAQWAAEEDDWSNAAEAARLAVAAADRVHRVQIGRTDREALLAATRPVHGDAANALLRVGMGDEALVTLEQGRAQLVSDALERDRAELSALGPKLSQAYTAAAARVVTAERASGGTSSREAHAALQDVIAQIRMLPGHKGFLQPMGLEGVTTAASQTPLVYVGSGTLGAVVVAALPGGRVVTRIIDGIDDYVVGERIAHLRTAQESRQGNPRAWKEALDDTGRWLGETVWPAVRGVLGPATRAVVVQTGLMTLLPLQVAWSEDDDTPCGRRYAIDDIELSFAPNARSLESCRRLAARTEAASVLTVGAPEHSDMAPLEHGASESAAVRAKFATGDSFSGSAATRDAVLDALPRHGVLHFACHGRARPDEPLESALLLAGDDALTVRDLLEHRLPGARLAVLSACETSVVGTRLVDEVVGLPTGFLQAGVAGVIATSWEVEDESAALLVRRFFDEWSGGSPAAALRAAQRWVRDSTNGDKLATYPDLAGQHDPDLDAEELEDWRTGLDHIDIQHWGGFIHAGA
jgi:tetratricopeptide (TPR) repeat protein